MHRGNAFAGKREQWVKGLWLQGTLKVSLTSNGASLHVPAWLWEQRETFLHGCWRQGFNTLCFGSEAEPSTLVHEKTFSLSEFFEALKAHPFKYIFHIEIPEDFMRQAVEGKKDSLSDIFQEIKKTLPQGSMVLWKGRWNQSWFHQGLFAREYTLCERVLKEIGAIEEVLAPIPLIYYLPASKVVERDFFWHDVERIELALQKNTLLAFPLLETPYEGDFLNFHPLFERLLRQNETLDRVWMPIFNLGAIEWGEMRWPVAGTEALERLIGSVNQSILAGVLGLVNQHPSPDSLGEAFLNYAGFCLTHWKKDRRFFDSWRQKHCPEVSPAVFVRNLHEASEIVRDYCVLRSRSADAIEEKRMIADSLLLRLKLFHVPSEKSPYSDACLAFRNELSRLVK